MTYMIFLLYKEAVNYIFVYFYMNNEHFIVLFSIFTGTHVHDISTKTCKEK